MSRVVNTIEVVNVSQFDGTATFLHDAVFKAGASAATSFAIRLNGGQTGNAIGLLPLINTTDTFVFNDFPATLTQKTLTNATLSSPYLTDPKINAIRDINNNIVLNIVAIPSTSTYNYFQTGATTSGTVLMSAVGSSANIGISIQPKGTGVVSLAGLTFPRNTTTTGDVLSVSGAGVLSFTTPTFPSESTFVTTASASTHSFPLGTVQVNQTVFYDVYVVGVSDVSNDPLEAGAFQIKTAYTRDNTNCHAIGAPTTDDILQFRDDTTWSVVSQTDTISAVTLLVTGSSSATVDWKVNVRSVSIQGLNP